MCVCVCACLCVGCVCVCVCVRACAFDLSNPQVANNKLQLYETQPTQHNTISLLLITVSITSLPTTVLFTYIHTHDNWSLQIPHPNTPHTHCIEKGVGHTHVHSMCTNTGHCQCMYYYIKGFVYRNATSMHISCY